MGRFTSSARRGDKQRQAAPRRCTIFAPKADCQSCPRLLHYFQLRTILRNKRDLHQVAADQFAWRFHVLSAVSLLFAAAAPVIEVSAAPGYRKALLVGIGSANTFLAAINTMMGYQSLADRHGTAAIHINQLVTDFDFGMWARVKKWYYTTGGLMPLDDATEEQDKLDWTELNKKLAEIMPHTPVIPSHIKDMHQKAYTELVDSDEEFQSMLSAVPAPGAGRQHAAREAWRDPAAEPAFRGSAPGAVPSAPPTR